MKLIQLTKGFSAMVDDEDYKSLCNYRWHVIKGYSTFYAVRTLYLGGGRKNKKFKHIFMHREILGATDRNTLVDHKDHNGLNNQRNNIRLCSRSENQKNKNSEKHSTSKYLGVDYDSKRNKWKSRIRVGGKEIFLGRFLDEKDAAKAYDEAARLYHGEFSNPNF